MMPEFLHADVYTIEAPSGPSAPPGISQSNAGFVGYSPRGMVNVASLVTSFEQYKRDWGGFTALSNVAQHLFAFFQNGGQRAYFARQVGAGAAKASGFIENDIEEEVVATGNGVLAAFGGTLGNFPVKQIALGSSIRITYKIDGAPVAAEASDMSPAPNGVLRNFVGKLGAAAGTPDQPIVPGTVTITDATAGLGEVYTDAAADGILVDAALAARGFVDYDTGHFTLAVAIGAIPGLPADVTYAYTPRIAGPGIIDDGAGNLSEVGVGVVGTINYTTGVWAVAGLGTAPSLQEPLVAAYTQNNVEFELLWEGTGGNNVRITVQGDGQYFTRATGTYTRAIVRIYEKDFNDVYQLKETWSAVSFSTVTDPKYLLTLVNNVETGSGLVELSTPTDLEMPQTLLSRNRTRAVSAGNGVATQFGSSGATPTISNPFVCDPLEFPVQPSSVSITWVDTAGTAREVTDDGNGNLIGDVDPAAAAGFNEIDYDTGEFAFQTLNIPGNYTVAAVALAPLVNADYYLAPTDTSTSDDAAGGTNGTLPLTRSELTDPALLKADREGVYALLKIDETMNVVVHESAGDVDILGDLVDEAKLNSRWFIPAATPQGLTPLQAQQWRRFTWGYTGNRAALYYPWIMVNDPVSGVPTAMPPLGHIAGIYANTVALKNVGAIPAGITRGSLKWLRGFERKLEDAELDILDPYQVNALRHTAQVDKVVWGAETTESPPGDYKYVHARLLVDFIMLSIFKGAHPFCFEDTGPTLWERVRTYAENFMSQKYGQGFFAGTKPSEAFYVLCNSSNNPDPDSEFVYCKLGCAAKKPAKFIVFEVSLNVPST